MTTWTSKVPARWIAAAILIAALGIALLRAVAPATAAPSPSPRAPTHSAARVRAKAPANLPAPRPQPVATAAATAVAAGPLVIRRVLETGGPIRYGSYFWDDTDVPDGPLTITVDLKASVLSVFRNGYEIGTTAVIYGADDRETPLGTFPILQKDRHHVSNLYHAPMPYMLRLTGDGVSIHASDVAADHATHGCIGVPAAFAAKLFAIARLGDRVIVTNQGLRTDMPAGRTV